MKLSTILNGTTESNIQISRPTSLLVFNFTLGSVPATFAAAVTAINTFASLVKVNINHTARATDVIKNLTLKEIIYFSLQKGQVITLNGAVVSISLPISYGKTYMFNNDDKLEMEVANAGALPLNIYYTTSHHVAQSCCDTKTWNNITTDLYRFERNTIPAGKFQDFPNDRYTSALLPTLAALEIRTKEGEIDKYSKEEMDIFNQSTQSASVSLSGVFYTNYENEFIVPMINVAKLSIDNDTVNNLPIYMIRQIS